MNTYEEKQARRKEYYEDYAQPGDKYDEAMKVMQPDAEKKKALDTTMGYISWPFYGKALKDLRDSFVNCSSVSRNRF